MADDTDPSPRICQLGCPHPSHDDPCAYLAKFNPAFADAKDCPCEGAWAAEMRAGSKPPDRSTEKPSP